MTETVFLYRATFNAVRRYYATGRKLSLVNMALYMKQLVTETEIDISVRDGRDKKRNKHENTIYNGGNI